MPIKLETVCSLNRDADPPGDFKDHWWKVLEKVGINDFHFYDLRHIFAASLIAAAGQSVTVQAAPGHANIKSEITGAADINVSRGEIVSLREEVKLLDNRSLSRQ